MEGLPDALKGVPQAVLEEYVLQRLRQFAPHFAQELAPTAAGDRQQIESALSRALMRQERTPSPHQLIGEANAAESAATGMQQQQQSGGQQPEQQQQAGGQQPLEQQQSLQQQGPLPYDLHGLPRPPPGRVHLKFGHECRYIGCRNRGCVLCRNNPNKKCSDFENFDEAYADKQPLRSKCGADMYVSLVGADGAEVKGGNVWVQLSIINSDGIKPNRLPSYSEVKQLELLKDKGTPVLACSPTGGTSTPSGHVLIALQDGRGWLPSMSIHAKTDSFKAGRDSVSGFRLAAVAVAFAAHGQTLEPLAGVLPSVSEKFVVKTQRACSEYRKLEFPGGRAKITEVRNIGVVTAQRLKNDARSFLGPECPLASIVTVEDLRRVVDAASMNKELEARLIELLNMKGRARSKYDTLVDLLRNNVVAEDKEPRVFFPRGSTGGIGIIYHAHQGTIRLDRPAAAVAPASDAGGGAQLQKLPLEAAGAGLIEEARAAWAAPGHPGWQLLAEFGGLPGLSPAPSDVAESMSGVVTGSAGTCSTTGMPPQGLVGVQGSVLPPVVTGGADGSGSFTSQLLQAGSGLPSLGGGYMPGHMQGRAVQEPSPMQQQSILLGGLAPRSASVAEYEYGGAPMPRTGSTVTTGHEYDTMLSPGSQAARRAVAAGSIPPGPFRSISLPQQLPSTTFVPPGPDPSIAAATAMEQSLRAAAAAAILGGGPESLDPQQQAYGMAAANFAAVQPPRGEEAMEVGAAEAGGGNRTFDALPSFGRGFVLDPRPPVDTGPQDEAELLVPSGSTPPAGTDDTFRLIPHPEGTSGHPTAAAAAAAAAALAPTVAALAAASLRGTRSPRAGAAAGSPRNGCGSPRGTAAAAAASPRSKRGRKGAAAAAVAAAASPLGGRSGAASPAQAVGSPGGSARSARRGREGEGGGQGEAEPSGQRPTILYHLESRGRHAPRYRVHEGHDQATAPSHHSLQEEEQSDSPYAWLRPSGDGSGTVPSAWAAAELAEQAVAAAAAAGGGVGGGPAGQQLGADGIPASRVLRRSDSDSFKALLNSAAAGALLEDGPDPADPNLPPTEAPPANEAELHSWFLVSGGHGSSGAAQHNHHHS